MPLAFKSVTSKSRGGRSNDRLHKHRQNERINTTISGNCTLKYVFLNCSEGGLVFL